MCKLAQKTLLKKQKYIKTSMLDNRITIHSYIYSL